jgi:hypothetical protein
MSRGPDLCRAATLDGGPQAAKPSHLTDKETGRTVIWNETHLLAEKHSAQHTLLLAASRHQAVTVKTPKFT